MLGDFSGVELPYFETDTTFKKRDDRYFVTIANGVGETQEYEVTYTFGVAPLQQYLVEFPDGRKQALQYAWDTRPPEDGGQRWFHLYPDEYIGPGDPLHWAGRYFNWNFMCAECHSTNVDLGYDIDSDSFETTFSEISVGCEACHGPGSRHVSQGMSGVFDSALGLAISLDDRTGAAWVMNADTGIAKRSEPGSRPQQPESCGRCHSRRSVIATDYDYGVTLTDTHMPSLLDEHLYHADGRIQDEVYVYGSFLQSKMYSAGVTCTDCHNPHSGELRAGPNPNDTCASCHLPARFATAEHGDADPGNCVDCHMRTTTYMGVDGRRDHSFRLPNAGEAPGHYGQVIAAGRAGESNELLLEGIANPSYPPIVRGTLLSLLEPERGGENHAFLIEQLSDPDPLVRVGALRSLRNQAPELRLQGGSQLLRDPVRAVRIEAALTYIDYRDLLSVDDARAFARAADEYREPLKSTAFMPEAAVNLAEFEMRLGNSTAAARMYEHAIRVGQDNAPAQHAYGLHLIRSDKQDDALEHLRLAADLAAEVPRFVYVYGVALNSLGKSDEAIAVLSAARENFPGNFDLGWALATMYRDLGEQDAARNLAEELAEQFPERDEPRRLADSLQ